MTETANRFPCDTCGADLRFDPDKGEMQCDYCGARQEIETGSPAQSPTQEQDYLSALNAARSEQETEERTVLTCTNCGAQVEFEPDIHAAECPFCATPVVTGTGTSHYIKPRGLLPFTLTEDAARDGMTQWLGKLWFAPNGLQEYARKGRKLEGIYVPYWTYDADTKSRYKGQRGTVYYETKTVHRNGKSVQQRVQKVRWRSVSGRVSRWFDDVLVLGSRSLPKKFTDALEPWDLSELEPYIPDYLAGFRAEGYTVELAEGYAEARAKMDRVIQRDVKFDIGGDRQRVGDVQTSISDVTFKHILLPVWLAAYKYRGRSYRFVVNGRTGRVQGERPWSAWKIAIAVLLGVVIAAGIGFFLATQQQ